jgi:hypothetical protein
MDFLTFLIRLIEALAWPVAAVVIMFVFRREFQALVPLVRKLKAGPLEAEFERQIQEISQEFAVKVVIGSLNTTPKKRRQTATSS